MCPIPSTVKTKSCSAAIEALLPASLIRADTTATAMTRSTDRAASPPTSSPSAKPSTAVESAPASRTARARYVPETSAVTDGSAPVDTRAP